MTNELFLIHEPGLVPNERIKQTRPSADTRYVRLCWIIVVLWLCGCDGQAVRMAQPESPQGRYHDQIESAKRLLEQKENWADRAEWEVVKTDDGWKVIAWRVEHPNAKGPDRYLPWGYSVIELDPRLTTVHYHRRG